MPRRFRIVFLLVALAVLAPLAFLVERALRSVELERQLRHRAVAERVFDEMERALSRLLDDEEALPADGYLGAPRPAAPPFIVGRFERDPGGGVQISPDDGAGGTVGVLRRAVNAAWRGGAASGGNQFVAPEQAPVEAQSPGSTVSLDERGRLAEAPVNERRAADTAASAVSAYDALRSLNKGALERTERQKKGSAPAAAAAPAPLGGSAMDEAAGRRAERDDRRPADSESMPLSGRLVDPQHLLLFRTVVRDGRAYRQGVLLDVPGLDDWLRDQALGEDGLKDSATVSFSTPAAATEPTADPAGFVYQHRFVEPFDDLSARLTLRPLPGGSGGTYVYVLAVLVVLVTLLGLTALYRMVTVVVSYAERRSNFVAAVTHELKTPLTAIRMYGEMLRDGLVPSEAKRAEYYRHITLESERLSRLINNVLELARLERGEAGTTATAAPVEPLLREVTELLRPRVEQEGFELRVDIAAPLPPARFDHDALVQVLCNFVDNAVKYARDAAPRQIALRAWCDGGAVRLAVRDHGPGVAAQHLSRIFDPFYRGEAELTRTHQGTGLGLALVRGLAERMGARVAARNVSPRGFEVEIALRTA